ncbi:unnamed protein product [Haemonchus placei]|uniref:SCP domain-containing protein n=1 Tax=Haemonchus placei TaxID=6290 RepID=A0A0N4WKE2_HAEPC|nr:unnamed protein product [Haemonchus placei]
MKSQTAFLLLSSLFLVDGRDEFEERKQFHEQLCRKRPSLSKCSEPFTKSTYEKELMDHHEKGRSSLEMTAARAFAARSAVKRESPWNDVDEDAEYEYYLWKKYRRAKLRQRLLEDRFECDFASSSPFSDNCTNKQISEAVHLFITITTTTERIRITTDQAMDTGNSVTITGHQSMAVDTAMGILRMVVPVMAMDILHMEAMVTHHMAATVVAMEEACSIWG